MVTGAGSSELFSVTSVHKRGITLGQPPKARPVTDVGVPYPGMIVGIFDKNGSELGYGERRELWVKSKTAMKEYYKKKALSEQVFTDGWLRTGDIYEMDEDGLLYLYGRKTDAVQLDNGETILLFDIANRIREDKAIRHCIVNNMSISDGAPALAAHIVLYESCCEELSEILTRIDSSLSGYLPTGLSIFGYKQHAKFLSSPTTGKKDRNGLQDELDGYLKPTTAGLKKIFFRKDSHKDTEYSMPRGTIIER